MKKIFFCCILLFSILTFFINGNSRLSVKLAQENQSIIVKIEDGTGPFIYALYDKKPWFGGKLIEKSTQINENTFIFSNCKNATYTVIVDNGTLIGIAEITLK